MAADPVIELGELGESTEHDRRWFPVGMRRTLVAAALAGICLLTLGAAQPAPPRLGGPMWTGTVGLTGFIVGSRSVYQYEPDGLVAIARDRYTGAEQWRFNLPERPTWTADLGHGVTGIAVPGVRRSDGSVRGDTILLVNEAGEQLARIGEVYAVGRTAAGRLLVGVDPDVPSCSGPDENCTKIAAYDVRTGVQAWRSEFPGFLLTDDVDTFIGWGRYGAQSLGPGRVERFATVTSDGHAVIRNADTGEPVSDVSVPEVVSSGRFHINLVGDALFTLEVEDGSSVAVQRRLPAPHWSASISDPPGLAGRGPVFLAGCGPVLCVYAGRGSVLIDAQTGTQVASVDLDVLGRLGNGNLLAGPPDVSHPANYGAPVYLLDHRDGAVVATFPFSGIVPWAESSGRALLARLGPERTGFTVLDGDGRVRSLGSVPGVGLDCFAHADVLACADLSGDLRVWRLPP